MPLNTIFLNVRVVRRGDIDIYVYVMVEPEEDDLGFDVLELQKLKSGCSWEPLNLRSITFVS